MVGKNKIPIDSAAEVCPSVWHLAWAAGDLLAPTGEVTEVASATGEMASATKDFGSAPVDGVALVAVNLTRHLLPWPLVEPLSLLDHLTR
jgi:hypothetical protein